ncbi:MAG: ATPase [Firmicutes bacterium]|nr:ATPase [Bacillota bacterium]
MAQKAIREFDGKSLLAKLLPEYSGGRFHLEGRFVTVTPDTDMDALPSQHPWLLTEKLVAKPDQLIKRRGKNKLIVLNADWNEAKQWIAERMNKDITIDKITGKLDTFIVEPFLPHSEEDECYLAIRTVREGDEILFHHRGGINVGDVDSKAKRLIINIRNNINDSDVKNTLLTELEEAKKDTVEKFIKALYEIFKNSGFAYMEINPILLVGDQVVPLDLAAKLDDTAEFECAGTWGDLTFPSPFGRKTTPEEQFIRSMDEKTGASLKLTLLNTKGRVWTMVAGGGASVIYADTIADLGYGPELANYGEYSGNPNDEETYQYAKTVLDLMTREKDPQGRGKVLLIGGGIANFTDVAKTFKGIIRALKEYKEKLKEVDAMIYVRRGGPNYKTGLKNMRELGKDLGVPIEVYGPETHMTRIVKLALDK